MWIVVDCAWMCACVRDDLSTREAAGGDERRDTGDESICEVQLEMMVMCVCLHRSCVILVPWITCRWFTGTDLPSQEAVKKQHTPLLTLDELEQRAVPVMWVVRPHCCRACGVGVELRAAVCVGLDVNEHRDCGVH